MKQNIFVINWQPLGNSRYRINIPHAYADVRLTWNGECWRAYVLDTNSNHSHEDIENAALAAIIGPTAVGRTSS